MEETNHIHEPEKENYCCSIHLRGLWAAWSDASVPHSTFHCLQESPCVSFCVISVCKFQCERRPTNSEILSARQIVREEILMVDAGKLIKKML